MTSKPHRTVCIKPKTNYRCYHTHFITLLGYTTTLGDAFYQIPNDHPICHRGALCITPLEYITLDDKFFRAQKMLSLGVWYTPSYTVALVVLIAYSISGQFVGSCPLQVLFYINSVLCCAAVVPWATLDQNVRNIEV